MGTMQHKYTREYFTSKREDGSSAGYGAEGYESYCNSKIRQQDLSILERIDFDKKRVLEFGFGRGESIKYILEHGASHYSGVDFAPAAHALTLDYLRKNNISIPDLYNEDALIFVESLVDKITASQEKFDIILMLDFVEHVERAELRKIFCCLHDIANDSAVIVVNTPAYLYDNDVFVEGLKQENCDTADLIEETKGMHCNKYTIHSLHAFMDEVGFTSLTESHFFIKKDSSTYVFLKSFYDAWQTAKQKRVPLLDFKDDEIESFNNAYTTPPLHIFEEGRMAGLSIHIEDSYVPIFSGGKYDDEIFSCLENNFIKPSTIFDVGGFMGISSMLFARILPQQGKVYCFEPNPINMLRIRKNLSSNITESAKIELLPYALGEKNTSISMLLSTEIDTGRSSTSRLLDSHCVLSNDLVRDLNFFEHSVSMLQLDTFVKKTQIIPDVIKVDIEGAEHLFLEGAIGTISQYHPFIFMEIHSPFCALKCAYLFEKLGYTLQVLHEESDNRLMVFGAPNDKKRGEFVDIKEHIRMRAYDALITRANGLERAITDKNLQIENWKNSAEQHLSHLVTATTELAAAQRTLNHPIIRVQRKLWHLLKRLK